MNRRDKAVAAALVILLGAIGVAVALPQLAPAAGPERPTAPSAEPAPPYREGVIGRPVSVNPLTARTQTDRDLVAILFPGLVALGEGETLVPALAESWSSDENGARWTFRLRPDATWHDGTPVTAADVVYTITTIQDPAFPGPAGASWRDVTVTAVDPRTVQFELTAPLGGFLEAALQPIAPAHLLADVPIDELETSAFNAAPIGSSAWELAGLDDRRAVFVPRGSQDPQPSPTPRAIPTDSLSSAEPTILPERAPPAVMRIEISFFDDAEALEAAFVAGNLDVAYGLPPEAAGRLATANGAGMLRYPGSTLTAVALNLRPSERAFATPAIRRALLASIDREALIEAAFGGHATRADSLIPPQSSMFDRSVSVPVAHDATAAERELTAAGWQKADDGWRPAGVRDPLELEVLSPDETANPTAFAAARAVAADWEDLGIGVTHTGLPPAELVRDRLQAARFSAAVLDIAIGLDPDPYALLASSQTTSDRTNFTGLQDAQVDALLAAARAPGSAVDRKAAYKALQVHLAAQQYVLPLAFRDVVVVTRDRVEDRTVRRLSDPSGRFWDVLRWTLASDA